MAKVNWGHLEIIEEWTPIDPSDSNAIDEEDRKLDLLASLIFKVYRREKLERAQAAERERQRIRKKEGLEL